MEDFERRVLEGVYNFEFKRHLLRFEVMDKIGIEVGKICERLKSNGAKLPTAIMPYLDFEYS